MTDRVCRNCGSRVVWFHLSHVRFVHTCGNKASVMHRMEVRDDDYCSSHTDPIDNPVNNANTVKPSAQEPAP